MNSLSIYFVRNTFDMMLAYLSNKKGQCLWPSPESTYMLVPLSSFSSSLSFLPPKITKIHKSWWCILGQPKFIQVLNVNMFTYFQTPKKFIKISLLFSDQNYLWHKHSIALFVAFPLLWNLFSLYCWKPIKCSKVT